MDLLSGYAASAADLRSVRRAPKGRPAAQALLTVNMPDGIGLKLRFGEQTDAQPINGGPVGELAAERAADYIAKYTTKSAEGLRARRAAHHREDSQFSGDAP